MHLPPTFLPWDHMLQRAYLDNSDFATSPLEPVDTVHLVWGVATDALDLSARDPLRNPSFLGTPRLDTSFALDGAAQRHLLRACDTLRNSSLVRVVPDFTNGGSTVKVHCWIDAFRDHVVRLGGPFPIERAEDAEMVAQRRRGAKGGGANLFSNLLNTVAPQQCESNYDCEAPLVCCDLIVASVCCSSGMMIGPPQRAVPQMQRQEIPVPVDDDNFPPRGGAYGPGNGFPSPP